MYTGTPQLQLATNAFLKARVATTADKAQTASVTYPEISEQGISVLDAVLQSDPVSRPTADELWGLLDNTDASDGNDALARALAAKEDALVRLAKTDSALVATLTEALAEIEQLRESALAAAAPTRI